ncbi:MAG: integrin alpha [Candidatus Midichloria sp.]|nr:integrin alpha [Candidatus Midichloria sp.]
MTWAAPGGKTYAGQVYVVFGRASFISSLEPSSLNGSNGFIINGIANGDNARISVSGAGDVNGDGFDGIVVGAWQVASSGRTLAGQAYVVFGKSSFTSPLELSSLNGSNGFIIKYLSLT